MAGHFAAFIDAGFLRASGATALGLRSHEVDVYGVGLINWLRKFRAYDPADEMLRAYWYDGAFDPSHPQYAGQRRLFDALDSVPGIELRLGHLVERQPKWHRALDQALDKCGVDRVQFRKRFAMKADFVQKGVDTILTMDLIRYAHAYEWAILIAGDRDLVDPVRSVQDEGRRVVLAAPERAGVAIQLRRRADLFVTIDEPTLRTLFKRRRPSQSPVSAMAS